MTTLLNQDDLQEIAQSNDRVLLYFWAVWCGPCQEMVQLVDRVASRYADQMTLVKVNVDKLPELINRFKLQSVPTMVLLDQGKEVSKVVGALNEQDVERWLHGQWPTLANS